MMKAIEINKRRKQITELLYEHKEVMVADLVEKFNLTDETIRKDLNYLEKEGVLKRSYGKAVLVKNKETEIELPPVEERTIINVDSKQKLIEKAITLIQSEDGIIGLDWGSTIALLADRLASHQEPKHIFTSSLAAIFKLYQSIHKIHCSGGEFNSQNLAFGNDYGRDVYADIQFDICFLGSSGVKNRHGFCSASWEDAETKRALMKKSNKVVVLLDAAKFETTSLVQVAPWSEVDFVITNKEIPFEYQNQMKDVTELILV